QLEAPRYPRVVRRAPEPLAQIGADAVDAVVPDPLDRGPELVRPAVDDLPGGGIDGVACGVAIRGRDGQEPIGPEPRQDGELHLVEDRTAGERVEHLDGDRLLARLEPHDGLEEKAVGAGGEVLERGGRERAAADLMTRER